MSQSNFEDIICTVLFIGLVIAICLSFAFTPAVFFYFIFGFAGVCGVGLVVISIVEYFKENV